MYESQRLLHKVNDDSDGEVELGIDENISTSGKSFAEQCVSRREKHLKSYEINQ
jgi:hypothetical protein